jgi:HlyD family secretion protein
VRKVLFFLIATGLVGVGIWFCFYRAVPVRYVYGTAPVTRGPVLSAVSATGTVNAVEMVEVGTQVSGTIQEIYVDFNSQVKKGELIALLDPAILQAKVEEAKASLALAEAGLARAKASQANLERVYNRNKELLAKNVISQSDIEMVETELLVAKASVQESNARVLQAKSSLNQAQTNLAYTRIVSPVDGVVISRQVDVGQTVAASLQTPTLFSIARDLTQMQIEASVDEADIGRIREGQRATFHVDAWPSTQFEAEVSQVRMNAVVVANVVTYAVILRVANSDLTLKPGMTANVSIITEEREDALRVPAAAFRFAPPAGTVQEEGDAGSPRAEGTSILGMPTRLRRSSARNGAEEQTVWLVEDGKLARSLTIQKVGISDRSWIEVISGDVEEGQELAVSFGRVL